MGKYKTDYLGVHRGKYSRIQAGELDGWSSPETAKETVVSITEAIENPVVPSAGKLLELGCGDGCVTVLLDAKTEFEVYGIDIVPEAIELARIRSHSRGCEIDFRIGNVLSLPWPDQYFDAVVDGGCLHCIVQEDRATFLNEVHRVLRPGGCLFVITLIGEPKQVSAGYFDPGCQCLVRDGIAGRHFGTKDSILAELQSADFSIVSNEIRLAPAVNENDELFTVALRC